MSEQKIPFLHLFSALGPESGLLEQAQPLLVTGAVIDRAARSLRAQLAPIPALKEDVLRRLERALGEA